VRVGWLAKIKLSNPGEFDKLLSAEGYKAFCEGADE
jgi:glycine cleavage system H protein